MDSILKIKDKSTGKWISIPAIKDDDGKSHIADTDNPHEVTAEQVGAIPITGGIVQGNLAINKSGAPGLEFYTGKGFAIIIKNAKNDVANPENNYDYGVLISDYAEETHGAGSLNLMLSYAAVEQNQFSMQSALRLASIINGEAKYYNIYGDHNKPTAEDVGAVPINGGTINGGLTVNGWLTSNVLSMKPEYYHEPIEIGQYIDLHKKGSTNDFDVRLGIYNDTLKLHLKDAGIFDLYGKHNKCIKTYTGLQSLSTLTDGETRTIDLSCAGDVLLVVDCSVINAPYCALFFSKGYIFFQGGNTETYITYNPKCYYENGKLYLTYDKSNANIANFYYNFNNNSHTYICYCL